MNTTHNPILPNFLIVGAAKSGTTALYYHLKGHPDIFLSRVKEPCFFTSQFLPLPQQGINDKDKRYIRSFPAYCELFEGVEGQKAIGEASADYLHFYQGTIPLIRQYLNNPRIIILLRNPMDRAFSAYMHMVRDDREYLPFDEALQKETERISLNWSGMWHYKARGMYFNQVKAFMTNFSHVQVLLYDDFKRDPIHTVQKVYRFLEVDPNYIPQHQGSHYNTSGVPRFKALNRLFLMKNGFQWAIRTLGSKVLTEDRWVQFRDYIRSKLLMRSRMAPEIRTQLQHEFKDEILRLQDLLKRDLNAWLQ